MGKGMKAGVILTFFRIGFPRQSPKRYWGNSGVFKITFELLLEPLCDTQGRKLRLKTPLCGTRQRVHRARSKFEGPFKMCSPLRQTLVGGERKNPLWKASIITLHAFNQKGRKILPRLPAGTRRRRA